MSKLDKALLIGVISVVDGAPKSRKHILVTNINRWAKGKDMDAILSAQPLARLLMQGICEGMADTFVETELAEINKAQRRAKRRAKLH